MIVLDCSYALALVMPDEDRPRTMHAVQALHLVAPAVWPLEIANAMAMAVQRGRIEPSDAARLAQRLDDYGVGVDGDAVPVHQRYLAARHHGLSAYDAAYLDLALQRRCGIATLDRRLAERARTLGVTVHD